MGDLTWTRGSPWFIRTDRHHIAKLLVHGVPGYLLWLDAKLVDACFHTAAEAKAYAARHEVPAMADP